ncbi:helix-turn-helix domain-containing protein [Kibdelosporangium phytohabitans]|uniref:AraC family transcriptional regulator n=1 Tax=Kibdelosporangium phytohabitans TaxID=860235 RepID=A0A0N7F4L5_9PSEU|nr:AraC family transcriptional regulator [Kibdelosporangium phytohabitans]ALG11767.1 AraC family transcriptional regulator [Kibdelosporangium phytohabitans]MBE1463170.1 AraC family transcriptional regulator [Kibdelosporangium phytohabitans]
MAELGVSDTNGILALPWIRPERTSAGLGWEHVYLSKQHERPYAAEFKPAASHQLIFHLVRPVTVRRGTSKPRNVLPGEMFLQPAHSALSVELGGELDTLHVYLADDALQADQDNQVRLAEELGASDPLLEQLALALDSAVRDWQPSARTYVDQVTALLASQLIRHHSAGRPAPEPRQSGLSDRQFERVRDLVAERLAEPVPLKDMAAVAGLSVSQFSRRFKATTGHAPHRFLLRMRLKQAELLLRTSSVPIADIAVRCGFSHQEHLTRAMRAHLSTTPGAVRAR